MYIYKLFIHALNVYVYQNKNKKDPLGFKGPVPFLLLFKPANVSKLILNVSWFVKMYR